VSSLILGISAFYHDSAAALIEDGRLLFAVQEERLSRKKHDPSFPAAAVRACLEQGGRLSSLGRPLAPADLAAAAFYEKPLLKFERLLETYYGLAPRGVSQFVTALPSWLGEKLFIKRVIRAELERLTGAPADGVKLLFPEHHLSHAASAFYPSPFGEAAILTVDGVGEWATGTISHGEGSAIRVLREQRFPDSLGLLYSAFTFYAGFKVNSGEYKLMGLAPYGEPGGDRTARFRRLILSELVDSRDDGSIRLNQNYFDYAAGLRMIRDRRWEQLFGLPRRKPEGPLLREHCDFALAAQQVTEEIVLKLAREARRLTGSRNLCLAGGVALNCVANGRLLRENISDDLWVQPAAGDAGGALGAALAAHHLYFGGARAASGSDGMLGAFAGPEYGEAEAEAMAREAGAVYEKLSDAELLERAAALIAGGAVIGWHQGRAEWGPRALGNRSILADARNPDMQARLNLKIKHRENFRPFAPSVLAEDAADYFEAGRASPYMLLVDHLAPARRLPAKDEPGMTLQERLGRARSDLPAVTHLDYSARVQTVHRETNSRYHALLSAFRQKTGCGVLVNTSFNVRGEPIVCSPADAYRCFMRTELDYLAIGNLFFDKKKQPAERS